MSHEPVARDVGFKSPKYPLRRYQGKRVVLEAEQEFYWRDLLTRVQAACATI